MTRLINNSLQARKETMLMIAEEVFAQYSFVGAAIRLVPLVFTNHLTSCIHLNINHEQISPGE